MIAGRRDVLPRAWITLALLWPVVTLNYLDRQIFSTMKRSIMGDVTDIGSEKAFGALMAAFLFAYGLLSPFGGILADRLSRRWVIIVSLAAWSAVTWLTGHATTYNQLWWARALMGFSEACYVPAGLAMIADYHASGTRSLAVGIHQSGAKMGVILGGMGGYVADSSYGWRAGFHWLGLIGVAYALVLAVCLHNPPSSPPRTSSPARPALMASLKELFGLGAFLLLILYFTLPALPNWVVKSWMPAVLADTFNLGQGQAGSYATLGVMAGAFAGLMLGGRLADRWQAANVRGRIYTSAIGMALSIPALIGIGSAPSLGVAVLFLVLFGLGYGFFDANCMPILCQIVRPELRATAFGLMNMVSVFAGGYAVDRMGAMRDAGQPQAYVFNACALAAAIAVVVVLLIRPKSTAS